MKYSSLSSFLARQLRQLFVSLDLFVPKKTALTAARTHKKMPSRRTSRRSPSIQRIRTDVQDHTNKCMETSHNRFAEIGEINQDDSIDGRTYRGTNGWMVGWKKDKYIEEEMKQTTLVLFVALTKIVV